MIESFELGKPKVIESMSKTIFNASRLSIFLLGLGFTMPSLAWVKSVSLERTFVGENIRVLEVEVSCKTYRDARRLRQVVSADGPWCSVDVPDMCADKKIQLARQICDLDPEQYAAIAAAKKADVNSASVTTKSAQNAGSGEASAQEDSQENLLQEKMLIEEQRIQLEQKRLELRKKEVALEKQLSEIS